MSNTSERTYQGERAARNLVSYLNGKDPRNKAGRGHITKLMEAFHEVLLLLEKNQSWVTATRTMREQLRQKNGSEMARLINKHLKRGGVFPQKPEELDMAERNLADEIARYERRPIFGLMGGDWEFTWGPTLPRKSETDDDWATADESRAADALIELGRERLLPRVQKCECGTWFFARFSHQHFCSPRCRSRHQQGSPEFKAYRRKYMRGYYRLLRSGKVGGRNRK